MCNSGPINMAPAGTAKSTLAEDMSTNKTHDHKVNEKGKHCLLLSAYNISYPIQNTQQPLTQISSANHNPTEP